MQKKLLYLPILFYSQTDQIALKSQRSCHKRNDMEYEKERVIRSLFFIQWGLDKHAWRAEAQLLLNEARGDKNLITYKPALFIFYCISAKRLFVKRRRNCLTRNDWDDERKKQHAINFFAWMRPYEFTRTMSEYASCATSEEAKPNI